MTLTPRLSPRGRLATVALVCAAALLACEARVPPPVAPVTDYVVKDGKGASVAITDRNADSVRAALMDGVSLSLSEADTSIMPVIVVRDAGGRVVHVGRAEGPGNSLLSGIAPDDIASVEVIKRRDVLPPGARGGIINVMLKPGAAWTGPSVGARQAAPDSSARGAVRVRVRDERGSRADVPRGDTVSVRPAGGVEPMVSLMDAEGRELWSGRALPREQNGKSTFGSYEVDHSDIDRVEVMKGPAAQQGGLINIFLKPGAKPLKR